MCTEHLSGQILLFIIYKVMKYRKIKIKYNVYLKKKLYFTCENIKSCISHVKYKIQLLFTVIIGYPLLSLLTSLSPFQIFKRLLLSYKWTKIQSVDIYFLNWIVRNLLVIKLSGFAEFSFS